MSTTLLEGHVVDVLASLPERHFHTVCTSPPYWQLRAYGTPPQVWDAPAGGCEHVWEALPEWTKGGTGQNSTLDNSPEYRQSRDTDAQKLKPGAFCVRCGAWRGELGQEPTPEAFVAHLVAVFDAVRRVLRDDGTLWVNLAGSYWSEPGGQNGTQGTVSSKAVQANTDNGRRKRQQHPVYKGLDWVDVPGLFAHAMQANGWLWRSDVVWVKPSALPESVSGTRWEKCRVQTKAGARSGMPSAGAAPGGAQSVGLSVWSAGQGAPSRAKAEALLPEWADCPGCARCEKTDGLVLRRGSGRPTKATERVLLFAKRAGYFFDQEAVREALAVPLHSPGNLKWADGDGNDGDRLGAVWSSPSGRNLRDWWVMGPEPLKLEHYAAFPSALPERCIKAGTSEWGCCPGCGAPWARVIQSTPMVIDRSDWGLGAGSRTAPSGTMVQAPSSTTLGWRPTCRCPDAAAQPPVPCRVLDPFSGSGTTLLAANRLGRDAWGVELKPAYNQLARKRVGREPLSLFATHGDTGGILPVAEVEGALVDG